MKVLDLCSGIGGFTIGLHEAGFETVAFCEIEPYCQAILKKHWPDIPIYNDVRDISAERLRADGLVQPEVIVGGYPCQPFSYAGQRRGDKDDRHLWPEIFRIVKDIRPTWCIFENVAGHITMGIDTVLSDLEAENYATRAFVIPACGVDAKHRRDRVWIVAYSNISANRRASRQYEEAHGEISKRNNGGVTDKSGEVCATVADTESVSSKRRTEGQVLGVKDIQGKPRGSGQGKQKLWAAEPGVGRVVDGVPNRSHRIKALGNAVVPEIPKRIGQVIMEMENDRTGKQSAGNR